MRAVCKDCGKTTHLNGWMIVVWACMNVEISSHLQERALFYFVVVFLPMGEDQKHTLDEPSRPKNQGQ